MISKYQIVVFLSIMQTILLLGHFVVYAAFSYFFNIPDSQLLLTKIVFFVLAVIFTASSVMSHFYPSAFGRFLYRVGAVWIGTFYWLFIASILSWFLYLVTTPFNLDVSFIAQTLLIIAVLLSLYGLVNGFSTKVRKVSVSLKNLPESWAGRKVVLLSDTHFGNLFNVSFAKKIAKFITEQNPDLILFPGDFFDGTPGNFKEIVEAIVSVKTKFGVFFASGNHEEFYEKEIFLKPLRDAGIKVLENEVVEVEGMQIAGVDYRDTIKADDFASVLKSLNLNPTKPSILLKHVPDNIPVAESFGIGLQVSGHTHLGQVYPLRYITKKIYGKFHYGLNSLKNTQVYTTSGAGSWGPPQRLGTNSEIILLTFNK